MRNVNSLRRVEFKHTCAEFTFKQTLHRVYFKQALRRIKDVAQKEKMLGKNMSLRKTERLKTCVFRLALTLYGQLWFSQQLVCYRSAETDNTLSMFDSTGCDSGMTGWETRVGAELKLSRVCAELNLSRICAELKLSRVCAELKLSRVCAELKLSRVCAKIEIKQYFHNI